MRDSVVLAFLIAGTALPLLAADSGQVPREPSCAGGGGRPAVVRGSFFKAPASQPAESGKPTFDKNSPFYFDGTIRKRWKTIWIVPSRWAISWFPASRSATSFPYRDDDVRMIHNIGAKFIGRAIYRWGEESKLGDPAFLEYAKKMVDRCMPRSRSHFPGLPLRIG